MTLLLAAACSSVDGGQAELCRQILPALEPSGRIDVRSISADAHLSHVVTILYGIGDSGRTGRLRCAFGGGAFDQDRLKIKAVEQDGVELGDARLYFLNRFWLGKPDALSEGSRRLAGLRSFDPLIAYPLSKSVGYFVQQVVNALPLGAFYGLLAVAYALVYGLVGRINLGFGQIAVAGAYGAVAMTTLIGNSLTVLSSQGVLLAALITLIAAAWYGAMIGEVAGRAVFLPLMRSSHRSFMIATIGLGIAIGEVVHLVAGARVKWAQVVLDDPVALIGGGFEVTISMMRLFEILLSLAVIAAVLALVRRSAFGRRWRAVADDSLMARMLGINVDATALVTFMLASALAAMSGALVALHYGEASSDFGLAFGLKALVAAVLGGIGSLGGAAFGGLLIGFAETFWSAYLPNDHRDVAVYALLILVLIFRPQGLFGRPDDHQHRLR